MGKIEAQASSFELGGRPVLGRSQRVSRKWAINGELKHLERLGSPRIVLYLVNRHRETLLIMAVCLEFAYIIWSKLG